MKQFFPGPLSENARNIMRRLGYGEQRTRAGQISYVRRVAQDRFPRYHAYVEDIHGGIQVNLHVDQKEASYEGTSAHAGEYEGTLVEREVARLSTMIATLKSTQQPIPKQHEDDTKGFWGKIFG